METTKNFPLVKKSEDCVITHSHFLRDPFSIVRTIIKKVSIYFKMEVGEDLGLCAKEAHWQVKKI